MDRPDPSMICLFKQTRFQTSESSESSVNAENSLEDSIDLDDFDDLDDDVDDDLDDFIDSFDDFFDSFDDFIDSFDDFKPFVFFVFLVLFDDGSLFVDSLSDAELVFASFLSRLPVFFAFLNKFT